MDCMACDHRVGSQALLGVGQLNLHWLEGSHRQAAWAAYVAYVAWVVWVVACKDTFLNSKLA
jgi:hypothetical protein